LLSLGKYEQYKIFSAKSLYPYCFAGDIFRVGGRVSRGRDFIC
jgi:hypothetical protein